MCGIAGLVSNQSHLIKADRLRRMASSLEHRGPDGEGVFASENVGLAFRRLSVLDLTENANQPMTSRNKRTTLVYNGEIYNFRDLKKDLPGPFQSTGDTEVVLKSIEKWGEEALLKFNGMFALAYWDHEEKSLTLARDRYGIKPLYYYFNGQTLVFGSEIKSIIASELYRTELDEKGLVEYFTFQNFFSKRTLYRGVHLLPAGCFLRFSKSGKIEIQRYWDFNFEEDPDLSRRSSKDLAAETRFLLKQATERQLVSDVEVGAYLSGGLDSGSITAFASRNVETLKSFTCGFDLYSASGIELGFDERAAAEGLSHQYQTEHYQVVIKSGDLRRVLPDLTRTLEEPRVGQSYPNYYAAKLASRFVKVVLSGAGGDELFGGYPWRYLQSDRCGNFEEFASAYYSYWQRLVPRERTAGLFRLLGPDAQGLSTQNIFEEVFRERTNSRANVRSEDLVNESLYFEAKTFLQGLFLVEDKISMAHGLETRVPFLDNDLVDFAVRLPVNEKVKLFSRGPRFNENEAGNKSERYFHRTKNGKLILRNALEEVVPPDCLSRAKQGFSAPDASWFRGESMDLVREKLFSKQAPMYDYLDYETVSTLVSDHLEGRENRRLLVWSLLNFEQWCREFL